MIPTLQAASIGEVLDAISKLRQRWGMRRGEEDTWFRGAEQPYSLLPSLYRPAERAARYDEQSLFEAFKAFGAALAPPAVLGEWDYYFLARHHGLPTRLLDWSANALAAVFFALEPRMSRKTPARIDALLARPARTPRYTETSPVLWVLEAPTLNAWSIRQRGVIAISSSLDSMLPAHVHDVRRATGTWPNRKPLAIVPRHSNPRLVAQAGRFTIHGSARSSIDRIADRERRLRLAKVQLAESHVANMWADLDTAGVNAPTLLKDLDSLATYLRHTYDQSRGRP